MDFGIFILMQQRNKHKTSHEILRDAVEQTRVADELGFGARLVRGAPLQQLRHVLVAADDDRALRCGHPQHPPGHRHCRRTAVHPGPPDRRRRDGGPAVRRPPEPGHRLRLPALRVRALRRFAGDLQAAHAGDAGHAGAGPEGAEVRLRRPVLQAARERDQPARGAAADAAAVGDQRRPDLPGPRHAGRPPRVRLRRRRRRRRSCRPPAR